MIRAPRTPAPTETTTREHVESVAAAEGLELIPAGEFIYAIRKRPLLGQPVVVRCPNTSQPAGLSATEGEVDGKQGGVHPDRTGHVAEGLDRRGLHAGSGVLDRPGPDPLRRGPGLSDESPGGLDWPPGDGPPVVVRCRVAS